MLRKLHWMSAALCLSCLLLFSVTGFVLHHAKFLLKETKTQILEGKLPADLTQLQIKSEPTKGSNPNDSKGGDKKNPSTELIEWVEKQTGFNLEVGRNELKGNQWTINFASPGKNVSLVIQMEERHYKLEYANRGAMAYLNDLHKARATGLAWTLLMDLFVIGCVFFAVTGAMLMWRNKSLTKQSAPWLVSGLTLPILVVIIFV